MRTIRIHISIIATLLVCVTGCVLFDRSPDTAAERTASSAFGKLPDRLTREALRLEILLIDRPSKDPLLKQMLWDEIDEIGAVDLDVRHALNKNGIRVGVAGSNLPSGLETIIKDGREGMSFTPTDRSRISHQPMVDLLESSDTMITVSDQRPERFLVNLSNDESHEVENAQCLFRVSGRRMQDGWAKLKFVPELHHGRTALRHQANELGWEMQTSQNIEPFYDLQFEVSLNVGEIAVISLDDCTEESIGHNFFTSEDERNHRVLLVRLASMETLEGVSARVTGELKSIR